MKGRFATFLLFSQWTSAIIALTYHVRFLLFVPYDAVEAKNVLSKAFYFITGLGHESFAVFFVVDGIVTGLIMLDNRSEKIINHVVVPHRLAEIYRIALPGTMLGAVLDVIGVRFFNCSAVYTGFPQLSKLSLTYSSMLGNLFLLQPFIVPTFGSNSMLYLLSYLFWFIVLFVIFLYTARLRRPYAQYTRGLLFVATVAVMSNKFLIWFSIWLLGIAIVVLSGVRREKPSVLGSIALFLGALITSRLIVFHMDTILPPGAHWVVEYSYLLVAVSFAIVACALYPVTKQEENLDVFSSPIMAGGISRVREAASFTFFFHFPVAMLLIGACTSLFHMPLMQQPNLLLYFEFTGLIIICIGVITLISCGISVVTTVLPFKRRRTLGPN